MWLHVLDSPESLEGDLERLEGVTIRRKLKLGERTSFVLAFVITQLALDKVSEKIARAAEGGPIVACRQAPSCCDGQPILLKAR